MINPTSVVNQRLSLARALLSLPGQVQDSPQAVLACCYGAVELLVSGLDAYLLEINESSASASQGLVVEAAVSLHDLAQIDLEHCGIPQLVELSDLVQSPHSWLAQLLHVHQSMPTRPLALTQLNDQRAAQGKGVGQILASDKPFIDTSSESVQSASTSAKVELSLSLCSQYLEVCFELIQRQRESYQEF